MIWLERDKFLQDVAGVSLESLLQVKPATTTAARENNSRKLSIIDLFQRRFLIQLPLPFEQGDPRLALLPASDRCQFDSSFVEGIAAVEAAINEKANNVKSPNKFKFCGGNLLYFFDEVVKLVNAKADFPSGGLCSQLNRRFLSEAETMQVEGMRQAHYAILKSGPLSAEDIRRRHSDSCEIVIKAVLDKYGHFVTRDQLKLEWSRDLASLQDQNNQRRQESIRSAVQRSADMIRADLSNNKSGILSIQTYFKSYQSAVGLQGTDVDKAWTDSITTPFNPLIGAHNRNVSSSAAIAAQRRANEEAERKLALLKQQHIEDDRLEKTLQAQRDAEQLRLKTELAEKRRVEIENRTRQEAIEREKQKIKIEQDRKRWEHEQREQSRLEVQQRIYEEQQRREEQALAQERYDREEAEHKQRLRNLEAEKQREEERLRQAKLQAASLQKAPETTSRSSRKLFASSIATGEDLYVDDDGNCWTENGRQIPREQVNQPNSVWKRYFVNPHYAR